MMCVLAIIPCKATSSRIERKNTQLLGGLPLFLWTVHAARAVRPKLTVMVSTDEGPEGDEIARLALHEGAIVLRRPAELCRDPAEAPDVAIHALERYIEQAGKSPDAAMILLPTSPLRAARQIEEALALHLADPIARNVVSVIDVDVYLRHKLCALSAGVIQCGPPLRDRHFDNVLSVFRQDGRPTYTHVLLSGALWIATPERLLHDRHVSAIGALPYVMDAESSIDIDTMLDLDVARAIVARRYQTVAA